MKDNIKIYFSDFFEIDEKKIDDYGAFNISLLADIPLFIDPFLLFNSKNPEYQKLHDKIIEYLRFLKDKSISGNLTPGLIKSWYKFSEVGQNWLGFSLEGNGGSGLGNDFAIALNENFAKIFTNYGKEQITKGTHLEKLCLVKEGVGKDNISDFTTNLIKEYLLEYTQTFSKKYIKDDYCYQVSVPRVRFNFSTESWESDKYWLPKHEGDYVLLTPKDILTRDDTWINKKDLVNQFENIPLSLEDEVLRDQVNNYFYKVLPNDHTEKEKTEAVSKTLMQFPVLFDYFIKQKENNGDTAVSISNQKVDYSDNLYVNNFKEFISLLNRETDFYKLEPNSYKACLNRVVFFKDVVENKEGYKYFYDKEDNPIRRESDLKLAYRFTWFGTNYDVNTEVNNGRGPVDTKVSYGSKDSTLVEFKLASNPQLEKNLLNQVEVYKKANNTENSIKVIIYFSKKELEKVIDILNRNNLNDKENIVLIDARKDNKISASLVDDIKSN